MNKNVAFQAINVLAFWTNAYLTQFVVNVFCAARLHNLVTLLIVLNIQLKNIVPHNLEILLAAIAFERVEEGVFLLLILVFLNIHQQFGTNLIFLDNIIDQVASFFVFDALEIPIKPSISFNRLIVVLTCPRKFCTRYE